MYLDIIEKMNKTTTRFDICMCKSRNPMALPSSLLGTKPTAVANLCVCFLMWPLGDRDAYSSHGYGETRRDHGQVQSRLQQF